MEYTVKFFRIAVKFLGATRIDLYELADVFRRLGYTMIARLPFRSFKKIIGGSGPIAIKENIIVDVNSERLIVGVSSIKFRECIDEFIMLEKAIISNFDTLREVHFYELLAEVEVKSKNVNPIKFLQRISKNNIVAKKFSNFLDEPLFIFGYKLARENTSPENYEWIDIEITPYLTTRPRSSIHISMVYRSKNREKVLSKGRNLEALVNALDELINIAEKTR